MAKFNIGFRCNDVLLEVTLVKEMLLAGLSVKRISRTAWSVENVGDEWVGRLMKVADRYWFW